MKGLTVSKWSYLLLLGMLSGCGGGSSPSSGPASTSAISSSHSSQASSVSTIVLSGRITYDFVPSVAGRLDYATTESRPVRGIVVELINDVGNRLYTTSTNALGEYKFTVSAGQRVRIRAYARNLNAESPSWDFSVTDNTRSNSRYAIEGELLETTVATAKRDLHASSGWNGTSYGEARAAAPFAIIDSIYEATSRLQDVHTSTNPLPPFPPLELRWSTVNKPVSGNIELGEIGTSSYTGDAIYILGSEDKDTDEFDRHVVLHEFVHYLEHVVGRLDNIGGEHWLNESLDFRVAYSEGLANALSGAFTGTAGYSDASGIQQSQGFYYDVSELDTKDPLGFFSEMVTQTFIYRYFSDASADKQRNLHNLLLALSHDPYRHASAFHSIYTLSASLEQIAPTHRTFIDGLLSERRVDGRGIWGEGESYFGLSSLTELYTSVTPGTKVSNLCVTSRHGNYNKLENTVFLRIPVDNAGFYSINVAATGDETNVHPEWTLFKQGRPIEPHTSTGEITEYRLDKGEYVLALTERRIFQGGLNRSRKACFELSFTQTR